MKLNDLTPEELIKLQHELGRMVFNLPAASFLAGHETARETVTGNYVRHTDDAPRVKQAAVQLLNDIFKRRSADIVERWGYDLRALVQVFEKWDGPRE